MVNSEKKKILVTGSEGFIGKNLLVNLQEKKTFDILTFNRGDDLNKLINHIEKSDLIVHLAGENRPKDSRDFIKTNLNLTKEIVKLVEANSTKYNKNIPIIFSSSIQVKLQNEYGKSKLLAEKELEILSKKINSTVNIFRLPGVFGKWSKPNYNSVVATFCNNIACKKSIYIDEPEKILRLVYIDDVIEKIQDKITNPGKGFNYISIENEYRVTLKEIASTLHSFMDINKSLLINNVGVGFKRALYSTFLSFFPKEKFTQKISKNEDKRGIFVEFLKTNNNGQISYFTALPGVTRGSHYHHTKSEKFLVIQGDALFKFRNIINDETFEIRTSRDNSEIINTIPGWVHSIKNIGENELIVLLWANELFNKNKPDTFSSKT